MGVHKSFLEESKGQWGRNNGQEPTTEELRFGCEQRMATSLDESRDILDEIRELLITSEWCKFRADIHKIATEGIKITYRFEIKWPWKKRRKKKRRKK